MTLLFWVAVALILYVYSGYPLALAASTLRHRTTKRDVAHLPTVTLIIAAHNEEAVIRAKIENSLALDYPKDRLEIIVASDGSTDGTNAIAREYASRGVILNEVTPRGGKTRALNLTIGKATGSLLVLSDANPMYQPDVIRKLVRHFADPAVGAVSGDVRLVDSAGEYATSEGLYYRYERWLQRLESRFESIIGADGAMYAIRKDLFRAPSNAIVIDDFVISMSVALLGYRVLYEPEAVAVEQGTLSAREEFRRKVRIVAGGIQALKLGEGVPRLKQPRLLWCYVSHKLLRWLMPCLLVAAFISSAALAFEPLYASAFVAQAGFYALAGLYATDVWGVRRISRTSVPYYFCLVNGAAMVGLWRGMAGAQNAAWNRTRR